MRIHYAALAVAVGLAWGLGAGLSRADQPTPWLESHGLAVTEPTGTDPGLSIRATDPKAHPVSIQAIRWAGGEAIQTVRTSAEGADRRMARYRLANGQDARVQAIASEHGLRLTLHAPAGTPVRPSIALTNVDRIVHSSEGKLSVLTVGKDAISLPAGRIVLQNRKAQTGLVLDVMGTPSDTLRARPDGKTLHLETLPGGPAQPVSMVIAVARFSGDALIALEDTPGIRPRLAEGGTGDWSARTVSANRGTGGAKPAVQHPYSYRSARSVQPASYPTEWVWFPDDARVFRPLEADPREARIQVGLMYGRHAEKYLDAIFGGDLGILRKAWSEDEELSISARGLVTSRFNTCRSNFPQQNTDFFGGVATAYRHGKNTFELFLFHESSHLGDEVMEFTNRRRIDYSRESVRLLYARDLTDELGQILAGDWRAYAGVTFNARAFPEDIRGRSTPQVGLEYQFDLWGQRMFAAADLQIDEANDWAANIATQFGVELGDPGTPRIKRPRVFVEFYNGFSHMGQFWDDRETYIMLGLKMDL